VVEIPAVSSPLAKRRVLAALVFAFPLVYHFRFVWPSSGMLVLTNDFNHLYFVYKGYLLDLLAHGHLPLWSPAEAGGYAFFGNPFTAVLYPPNLVLLLVRLIVGNYNFWFHQIFTVLGVSLFALGLYRWLVQLFDRPGAALFAAITLSTSWSIGLFMRFPNAIHAIAWVPWVLAAIHAAHHSTRLRPLYLGVFALFCQLTAGYPYFIVYSFFLYAGYVAYLHLGTPGRQWRARALRQAFLLVTPVLLALPYTQAVSRLMSATTDRSGGDFAYATEHQFGPLDLLGSLVFPPVVTIEGCFYVGTLSVFLVILYLWRGRDLREKVAVVVAAMGFFALILGFRSYVFAPVWTFLPVVNQMRVFPRMTIILLPILGLAVHQGYGLLSAQLEPRSGEGQLSPRAAAIAFGVIFAVIFAVQAYLYAVRESLPEEYRLWQASSLPVGSRDIDFLMYTVITAGLVLFVVNIDWARLRHGPAIALCILLAVVTQDTGTQGRFLWSEPLAATLRAYGVDTTPAGLAGRAWALARRTADFHRLVRDYFTLDRRADTGALTADGPSRGLITNFDYASYTRFHKQWAQRPDLMNRLLGKQKLFFHTRPAPDDPAGFLQDVDASRSAAGEPAIRFFDGSDLRLEIATSRPGYLAWTDNWDPGWSAEVDGARTPVLRLLGTFKTVPLERPGPHRVRLVYRPVISPAAYAAMGLGVLGLILPPVFLGRLRRGAASQHVGLSHAA
jgi:hypothetical protein